MSGDVYGNQTVAQALTPTSAGFQQHLLMTGVNRLYEVVIEFQIYRFALC